DVEALRTVASPGTHVYLSAVPSRPIDEIVAPAIALRDAGFEPVPHIAVRNFESAAALDTLLGTLAERARVQRLLVIRGDRDPPAGFFHAPVEAIDGGPPQRPGLRGTGIAGSPRGHPRA